MNRINGFVCASPDLLRIGMGEDQVAQLLASQFLTNKPSERETAESAPKAENDSDG